MLKLSDIVKDYKTGDETVHALKGINIEFRDSEFVSVLGQSGCGKTTLLNIIGGLDKYTSGDLIINGTSTKKYKDCDWDAYRNHSIGFVFQSYNLIPHQTVLSNVELALTISGVSKAERRKRAIEALEQVGLGDQLKKKPNQMSGGQMQRVAIARALVNDPDIILADEPTGALDSVTSVQIMEILKKISAKKLIIMVTHNPELAEQYSTRIVKLKDGLITDDSMPYEHSEEKAEKKQASDSEKPKKRKKKNKSSMSLKTAFSLSLNNLWTKKTRTFLTSFAGSIGIIGIALILSLSTGAQAYINRTEREALANYPIQINEEAMDMTAMMSAMSSMGQSEEETTTEESQTVKSNNFMTDMITMMYEGSTTNNLTDFKKYLEENPEKFDDVTADIQYQYSTQMNIYKDDISDGIYQVNPSQVFQAMGMSNVVESSSMMSSSSFDIWLQLPGNEDTIKSQYEVVSGKLPEGNNEAVIVLDENGKISDFTLYALGLLDSSELTEMMKKIMNEEELEDTDVQSYSYDELLDLKFRLLLNSDYFEKNDDGIWEDKSDDETYLKTKISSAHEIKIVGILKAGKNTGLSSVGGVGYTSELMQYLVNEVNESDIVKEQKEKEDTDIFTGIKFETSDEKEEQAAPFTNMEELSAYIQTLPEDQQAETSAYLQQMTESGMDEETIVKTFADSLKEATTDATYDGNLQILGVSDIDSPSSILIYPVDFDSKDIVCNEIDDYNKAVGEEDEISYTDMVGLMMSSVTTILTAITSILVGFVSISLVVSSIMIAIITYISVIERTKEIGILRAIGASKRNISSIFNAEALIIGFAAGAIGIIVTILLNTLISAIVKSVMDIEAIAQLPIAAGVILVVISMLLSFIAGVIPARIAAKKDPVIALRTE